MYTGRIPVVALSFARALVTTLDETLAELRQIIRMAVDARAHGRRRGSAPAAAFTQNGPRFASELAQMFEIRGSVARTGGMEPLIAAGRGPENASLQKRVPVNQTIVPF